MSATTMIATKPMRLPLAAILLLTMTITGCGDDHREERLHAAGPKPTLDALLKVASAEAGEAKFRHCQACHTIIEDALDKEGPNLFGVFNQPIGHHRPNYPYTAALKAKAGHWDAPTLDAWMANPQRLVPGTKMQFAGVPDPLDRADIIAFLRSKSRAP
jgi:cytochrome c